MRNIKFIDDVNNVYILNGELPLNYKSEVSY